MSRTGYRSGELRTCCVCGKERYFRPSEIKRGYGRYCSRECFQTVERVEKKKCLICGKELKKTEGCEKGKYCSYECFGKSIRTRLRSVCCHCGKEFERKPFHLTRSKQSFCSKECFDAKQRNGRKDQVCKVCGRTFSHRGRRTYQYCSSRCMFSDSSVLARMAEQHRKQLRKIGLNKLEVAGGDILRGMGIKFEEQVLLFDRFTVDVFIESRGIVIQWDGDYWHGNSKVFRVLNEFQKISIKHDKACNAYLRKCGMKVLRFWERDVKRRPEWVASEIKGLIGG